MAKKHTSPPKLSVHFIGIGGIGISALARWFSAQNWVVSGSDLTESLVTESLRKSGVRLKIGHKAANLPRKLDMVVYSVAVHKDNPEFREAVRRNLKPLSYPEVIGCLTKLYKTVAIAGSHGKSTTTAMVGLILTRAGLDPNVVVGTNLKEFRNRNFRFGRSKWLVLEADEWRASFLNYHPFVSVITNIDKEHLDYYRTFSRVKNTFISFLKNTQRGGCLVLNRDDKTLYSLRSPINQLAKKNSLRVLWYSRDGLNARSIAKKLKIAGEHNLSNALAALGVAKVLGIKSRIAMREVLNYRGAWRRMEFKGNCQISGIRCKIFDDYAHHPTEIMATLRAFREMFPNSPVVCVYQPHQIERLKALFKEFVGAFLDAHVIVFLPIYEVAGRDRSSQSFTSERLARVIFKKYPRKHVFYLKNPKQLKSFLKHTVQHLGFTNSPIIVMMGAGNIVNLTPRLLS